MDHIFQKPDIEEICTAAKKAITDTKDCIADIRQTAAAISAAAGNVPAEAKAGDLAGTAGSLPGKLEKDNYDVTKQKLTACHEKACSIIPAYDSRYAEEMQEITAATRKIKKVIEELQEFMLETPLTTPKKDFAALLKEERGNTQSYLWDGNVAGIREDMGTASHYYFQDELGSPVRLMDKNGELAESYGYDEFGQDLYWDREETAGRSLTGSIQPFGYTGYQYDKTAGTYYAQAREYRAELGRFAAVDTIKGFAAAPYTLNEYGYCWGNPMVLVDLDGAWPQWIIDAFNGDGSEVPEWLERIIEGDEAHRLLQARFMQDYGGRGGAVEYGIGSGVTRNKSGRGRADIVYFNSLTRSAEVYEIKPLLTYGPGMPYHSQGVNQMRGYTQALNENILQNGWIAQPGMTLNGYFDRIVIPSKLFNGKKDIVYHVYENGMITYFYRDRRPEKQPSEVIEGVEEKLEEWQRNLVAAWEEYGTVVIMSLIVLLLIACVASGGSATPAFAPAIIVLLLINRELVNQTECEVS